MSVSRLATLETIDRLEQQKRVIIEPSEQAFVAKVKEIEHDRAQAASHIQEQLEEAAARERDIAKMQVHTSVQKCACHAAVSFSSLARDRNETH